MSWMLGPRMNSIHVKDKLYIQDLKFIYNMKISDNKLAQSCFRFACSDANSIIGKKLHILGVNIIFRLSITLSERELTSLRNQLNFVRSYNLLSITSGH